MVRVMGVPHALGVLLLVLGIVDSTRPGQVHEEDGVPVSSIHLRPGVIVIFLFLRFCKTKCPQ